MKRMMILLMGALFVAAPMAEAKPKHWKHRHKRDRDHHGYVVSSSRVPWHVHRRWNRNRVYSWNDHRYHWRDGTWVVYTPISRPRLVIYR